MFQLWYDYTQDGLHNSNSKSVCSMKLVQKLQTHYKLSNKLIIELFYMYVQSMFH